MSEDEMLQEFADRAAALLERGGTINGMSGRVVYSSDNWSVVLESTDGPVRRRRLEVAVATTFGLRVVFQKDWAFKGRILVEDYEAEEFLKDMRAHMVLDDLADV